MATKLKTFLSRTFQFPSFEITQQQNCDFMQAKFSLNLYHCACQSIPAEGNPELSEHQRANDRSVVFFFFYFTFFKFINCPQNWFAGVCTTAHRCSCSRRRRKIMLTSFWNKQSWFQRLCPSAELLYQGLFSLKTLISRRLNMFQNVKQECHSEPLFQFSSFNCGDIRIFGHYLSSQNIIISPCKLHSLSRTLPKRDSWN